LQNTIYKAAIYARASREDEDSSITIQNQKDLVKDYISGIADIEVVGEYEDDGYSGIDFLRPGFTAMMEKVNQKDINCIVVKDLSRLGRNYIEVGKFMEVIFPNLDIRFISVNDQYDTAKPHNDANDLLIPFKNILNESYLRDISIKIRSNLAVKRKKGEFVSAFASYGYIRDPENRHRMIIDDHSAGVVRDIYRMKIEGFSCAAIAQRLNGSGEPAPSEYKVMQGMKYTTAFKKNIIAQWSVPTIIHILKNRVYTGILEQGKQTTVSYKVKKKIFLAPEKWAVIKDAHEEIVSPLEFETVQHLMELETRVPPGKTMVYPLSGFLYCNDCGNILIRRTVTSKGKKYFYYMCGTHKCGKGCTAHRINEKELITAVLTSIKMKINVMLNIEHCFQFIQSMTDNVKAEMKLNTQILDRKAEINDCESYKMALWEDYKNGLIEADDFKLFSGEYTDHIAELRKSIEHMEEEIELLTNNKSPSRLMLENFKYHRNITVLNREAVSTLIDRIDVYENKRIEITLKYEDKYKRVESVLQKTFADKLEMM